MLTRKATRVELSSDDKKEFQRLKEQKFPVKVQPTKEERIFGESLSLNQNLSTTPLKA